MYPEIEGEAWPQREAEATRVSTRWDVAKDSLVLATLQTEPRNQFWAQRNQTSTALLNTTRKYIERQPHIH